MNDGRPNAQSGAGERILVVRTRFIGDTLLAIPFFRNLRRALPRAVVHALVEPVPGSLLEECPHIDRLVQWRRKAKGGGGCLHGVLPAARQLRREGYTKCFLLRRSFDVIRRQDGRHLVLLAIGGLFLNMKPPAAIH